MKLINTATNEEVKEGSKLRFTKGVHAKTSRNTSPREVIVGKIEAPGKKNNQHGLIYHSFSDAGGVGSWQQHYPHVLGCRWVQT